MTVAAANHDHDQMPSTHIVGIGWLSGCKRREKLQVILILSELWTIPSIKDIQLGDQYY